MTTEELENIYLVFWNPYVETPPTLSEVRARLVRNNLNPERAAEVAASTAMRRAADVVKSKSIEAKTFTCRESNLVRTQIDRIDEDNGRLRRAFMAQYELDANDYPRHIAGEELAEFVPAFDQAKSHYTGADLSKVIQAILVEDGLGAFSPRKYGGVYFVPVKPEAADLLDRISRFAEAFSVRFLVYAVPDTSAQREEIADAIAQSYRDEISQHRDAIKDYTWETKTFVFTNRHEAIKATAAHMEKLRGLMNGRYDEFKRELESLAVQLVELENEQQSRRDFQTQQEQHAGRRRIVTSGV